MFYDPHWIYSYGELRGDEIAPVAVALRIERSLKAKTNSRPFPASLFADATRDAVSALEPVIHFDQPSDGAARQIGVRSAIDAAVSPCLMVS